MSREASERAPLLQKKVQEDEDAARASSFSQALDPNASAFNIAVPLNEEETAEESAISLAPPLRDDRFIILGGFVFIPGPKCNSLNTSGCGLELFWLL